MIYDMTNISLFHNSCRGLHAPRDKYIFDRSVAEGFLRIELDKDFLPIYSFSQFSGDVEPSDSNVQDTIRSLRFHSRDLLYQSLSIALFKVTYNTKRKLTDVTLDEVEQSLEKYLEDCHKRKGSIHFHSHYIKALLDNANDITTYLQNGNTINVY